MEHTIFDHKPPSRTANYARSPTYCARSHDVRVAADTEGRRLGTSERNRVHAAVSVGAGVVGGAARRQGELRRFLAAHAPPDDDRGSSSAPRTLAAR
jgi:hypothetical protein